MDQSEARQRLLQLTTGYSTTLAIFAAAELGVPDLIASNVNSIKDLTQATATNPAALYRFMRFLVSVGIFDYADGTYRLTPMGQLLRTDVDGSRRANARILGRFLPAWLEILHSLRTGKSGFSKVYNMDFFDYFAARPDEAEMFDIVMGEVHGPESAAISLAYDFASFRCVMDVGGGNGSQLMDILKVNPTIKGVVFDRPDVAQRTDSLIAKLGLSNRCRTISGNFFESVPTGADLFLLRHVLHDWNDDDAVSILHNCQRALPKNGRILVAEMIVPNDNQPSPAKLFDLSMLVLVGGLERTEDEYRRLFDRAELSITNIIPTESPTNLIEVRSKS